MFRISKNEEWEKFLEMLLDKAKTVLNSEEIERTRILIEINPKDLVVEDKKICVRKLEVNANDKTRGLLVSYSFGDLFDAQKEVDIQYKLQRI